MTETTTAPVPVGQEQEDDVAHVTCCEDDDAALCGKDVTDEEWTDDEKVPDCKVCERIEAALTRAALASKSGQECIGCWVALLRG